VICWRGVVAADEPGLALDKAGLRAEAKMCVDYWRSKFPLNLAGTQWQPIPQCPTNPEPIQLRTVTDGRCTSRRAPIR